MKKFLIVVCVVGLIIFLGYIGKDMDLSSMNGNNANTATNSNVITAKNNTSNKNNNESKTNTTNNTNNTANSTNNTNETEKNNTTNSENSTNTTNNTTENSTTNQTDNNQGTKAEEVTTSDEDKAKDLAKNAYGSTDGVYFKVEQVESNGVYIISVRDMETTSALAWYNVNVKTGSVK